MSDLVCCDHSDDPTPCVDGVPDSVITLILSAAIGWIEALKVCSQYHGIDGVFSDRHSQSREHLLESIPKGPGVPVELHHVAGEDPTIGGSFIVGVAVSEIERGATQCVTVGIEVVSADAEGAGRVDRADLESQLWL